MLGNIIETLTKKKSKYIDLNLKELPSLGLFYSDDFKIKIKKADTDDIIKYEYYFEDDILVIVNLVKDIIVNNTKIINGTFNDIVAIDIMFIFLKIVEKTKEKEIKVNISDLDKEIEDNIDLFKNFKYFKISKDMMAKYDETEKIFNINNLKFSLAKIGIENSVTEFLHKKCEQNQDLDILKSNFNFIFFLGKKSSLTEAEIDNLVTIFTEEMDEKELENINSIVEQFDNFTKYKVKWKNKVYFLNKRIDWKNIWQ